VTSRQLPKTSALSVGWLIGWLVGFWLVGWKVA